MKRLLLWVVTLLFVSSVGFAQSEKLREQHGAKLVEAVTVCNTKGSINVNASYQSTLGDSGSCSSFDATYGLFYSDFFTINLTAGHTYRGTFSTSSFTGLGAFQSFSTGSILAATGLTSNGSVNYTPSSSGTVSWGLGAYGHGFYTFSVTDITVTAPSPTCTGSSQLLCLNASRFRVNVNYNATTSGAGTAVALTNDTGYFWFFSSGNVELVVKVVDGRSFNNHFWVFAGGLTNVGVTITVTDTVTGQVRTYQNTNGVAFQPIQDTAAF